jgi:hypothetical protein
MTASLHPSTVVAADRMPAPLRVRHGALLDLADDWVSSEAASVRQPGRISLVRIAVDAAIRYEDALAAASPDDVRFAWQQAVARQAQIEVGSAPWTTAFRVAELLRFEYTAVREARDR